MNDITLTLGQACMLVIVFFVIILLLYLICLLKNLLPSVKALAKVMENMEVITDSAARSTEKAETVVSDVTDIASSVVQSLKGQTTLLGQLSSIAAGMRVLIDLFSRAKEEEAQKERTDSKDVSHAQESPDSEIKP